MVAFNTTTLATPSPLDDHLIIQVGSVSYGLPLPRVAGLLPLPRRPRPSDAPTGWREVVELNACRVPVLPLRDLAVRKPTPSSPPPRCGVVVQLRPAAQPPSFLVLEVDGLPRLAKLQGRIQHFVRKIGIPAVQGFGYFQSRVVWLLDLDSLAAGFSGPVVEPLRHPAGVIGVPPG